MQVKNLLYILLATLLFSCQKKIDAPTSINGEVVTSDALAPLPCHTTSFATNYPNVAGQNPPFKFTKTQYSDGRINSVKMITRYYPKLSYWERWWSAAFYEWDYKFTYSYRKATMTGTRKWYFIRKGTTTKLLQETLVYPFQFTFNAAGFVTAVDMNTNGKLHRKLTLVYSADGKILKEINGAMRYENQGLDYQVYSDSRGNITQIVEKNNYFNLPAYVKYTYNYTTNANKKYFYSPTQYAVDQYFNLLEVMQWIPPSKNERKTVVMASPNFALSPYQNTVQGQSYLNHKYDATGNLLSYTYKDNVLQKTTWICK